MRCQVLVSHFISQFLGATLAAGHGLIPHVAWITWLCMTMVRREEQQIPSDHYCCTILWPFFVVVAWSMKILLYLTVIVAPHLRLSTGVSLVSVATPFMFPCQAFQTSPSFSLPFRTCSFPLLLSCIFQPLLYCWPTGERDMFAHSLTRRVWHLREQICSCKVNHTRGNYGLFVGICRGELGIWPGVLWPRERPIYNCYTSFTRAGSKWWQMLSWCSLLYILILPCATECAVAKEESARALLCFQVCEIMT